MQLRDRVIIKGGRKFTFWTNVERGRREHGYYIKLEQNGLPIVFAKKAYAENGARLFKFVAVFIDRAYIGLIERDYNTARQGELEAAWREAENGMPHLAFPHLSKCGGTVDGAVKKEVMAMAYQNAGIREIHLFKDGYGEYYKRHAMESFAWAQLMRNANAQAHYFEH